MEGMSKHPSLCRTTRDNCHGHIKSIALAKPQRKFVAALLATTYGLGKFYNGCASRTERGLEISVIAVVDFTQKGAYVASVEQTPPTLELKKEQASVINRIEVTPIRAALA
jgi:hypothetical protein